MANEDDGLPTPTDEFLKGLFRENPVLVQVLGTCRARLKGEGDWREYGAGTFFAVPGNSAFDIAVESGIAEYVCSFG